MSKQQESEDKLSTYIDALMESFKPALNADDATHFFTTDEVYEAIVSLNPGAEISKNDVYQSMVNYGFRFKPRSGTSGINFRWLLIAK